MLTISLHGIQIHAKIGLYPEEKIKGNDFETDVDVYLKISPEEEIPFLDYSIIYSIVKDAFGEPGELLETFAGKIHARLKERFEKAERIRIAIRKLNPPLGSPVRYSQVCFEK